MRRNMKPHHRARRTQEKDFSAKRDRVCSNRFVVCALGGPFIHGPSIGRDVDFGQINILLFPTAAFVKLFRDLFEVSGDFSKGWVSRQPRLESTKPRQIDSAPALPCGSLTVFNFGSILAPSPIHASPIHARLGSVPVSRASPEGSVPVSARLPRAPSMGSVPDSVPLSLVGSVPFPPPFPPRFGGRSRRTGRGPITGSQCISRYVGL